MAEVRESMAIIDGGSRTRPIAERAIGCSTPDPIGIIEKRPAHFMTIGRGDRFGQGDQPRGFALVRVDGFFLSRDR